MEAVLEQGALCLRDLSGVKSPLPLSAILLILHAVTPP